MNLLKALKMTPLLCSKNEQRRLHARVTSKIFNALKGEGAMLENEIKEIARGGNMRVIGPNCLGVMDT